MNDGFLNINKPINITSHDVVNRIRRLMNTKKVGHAGTLDPFAIGVLPVAVDRATKFIEYLSDCDKSYRAEIFFGIQTDSGDLTGKIINQQNDVKLPNQNEIESALQSFVGTINQTPPKFSAIKINGRKAYDMARKNIEFEIPPRLVTINSIKIISLTKNSLTIDIDCSKGTYIRSLAVDIGKKLNLPATLNSLQRTRVGSFLIDDSVDFDNLNLIPIKNCLQHLDRFDLPSYRLNAFKNGLSTRINQSIVNGVVFRVYIDDEFIGTGKIVDGELKADKVLLRD